MSSVAFPDTLIDVVSDSENLNKTSVEEVHTDAKPENNGTVSDTHIHMNDIELDPIPQEDKDSKTTGVTNVAIRSSASKEADNTFVVQFKTSASNRERALSIHSQRSIKRRTSLPRKVSATGSLARQESWRTKSSGTRIKNKKNYISYHDITYTVPQGRFFQQKPPKVILNNISGIMRVGVNAIMGPSGSGKSSLLDVLADRKDRRWVSGHVLINGEKQPRNFKCASGYVVQDDILTGTMTVRENVYLSASLRLPSEMDHREKEEKVDEVIEELGLSHVANSLIGTPLSRGVSGGQRKRCSIAMEMVVSPGILFLDEPTTGLDTTTAESVTQMLHNLSKEGRVIVMSIHQPRYSIFRLFDHITLMSQGNVIYAGAGRATLPYFSEVLGLECDLHDNPADFFLDRVSEAEENLKTSGPETGDSGGNPLADKWLASENHQLLDLELEPLLEKAIDQPDAIAPKYATNPLTQCYYLYDRGVRTLFRNPAAGLALWMQNLILGLFTGFIFFQLEDDGPNVFVDRSGALFFSLICNLFAVLASMELLIGERALFIHENASGYYRVSSYYISKLLGDLIPLRIIPIPIFALIAYWMIGLQADAGKFFLFMLAVFAQNFALSGMVYCIAVLTGNLSQAQILLNMVVLLSMLFGGIFVSFDSMPVWLSWIQWLSPLKYSFTIVAENELRDTVFCVTFDGGNCTRTVEGNDYLRELTFLDYNIWFNFLGLGLLALSTLILAYILLLRVQKTK